jgi:hypothetical protein
MKEQQMRTPIERTPPRRLPRVKRAALLITVFVFDLWLADSGYGVRRCRGRFEGAPRMREE